MENKQNERVTHLSIMSFLILMMIGLFAFITFQISGEGILAFDAQIIAYVQSFVTPEMTAFVLSLTEFGSVKYVVAFVLILGTGLFFTQHNKLALFVVVASGGGAALNLILKNMISRDRPNILPIIEASGYSFPSGHSMGSLIFYGSAAFVIVYFTKESLTKWGSVLALSIFISSIGVSRIYLGVHYPTDVIGGFAMGIAWLFICIIAFKIIDSREYTKK